MNINNFSIFKKKPSDNEKAPTHGMSTKIGEAFVEIGACWTKKSAKGDSYLSCSLQKEYKDHTDPSKSKKGFAIIEDNPSENYDTEVTADGSPF